MPENSCCHQETIQTIDFVSVTFLEVKYTLYSVHVLYYDIAVWFFSFLQIPNKVPFLFLWTKPQFSTSQWAWPVVSFSSLLLQLLLFIYTPCQVLTRSPGWFARIRVFSQTHNISLNVHLPLLITVLIRLQAETANFLRKKST